MQPLFGTPLWRLCFGDSLRYFLCYDVKRLFFFGCFLLLFYQCTNLLEKKVLCPQGALHRRTIIFQCQLINKITNYDCQLNCRRKPGLKKFVPKQYDTSFKIFYLLRPLPWLVFFTSSSHPQFKSEPIDDTNYLPKLLAVHSFIRLGCSAQVVQ